MCACGLIKPARGGSAGPDASQHVQDAVDAGLLCAACQARQRQLLLSQPRVSLAPTRTHLRKPLVWLALACTAGMLLSPALLHNCGWRLLAALQQVDSTRARQNPASVAALACR